jgi:hypothetical protein
MIGLGNTRTSQRARPVRPINSRIAPSMIPAAASKDGGALTAIAIAAAALIGCTGTGTR